jgi:transposase
MVEDQADHQPGQRQPHLLRQRLPVWRRDQVGGVATKAFVFVATLGYSRRLHVRALGHEKRESWLAGMESAFLAFGGSRTRCCSTTPGR